MEGPTHPYDNSRPESISCPYAALGQLPDGPTHVDRTKRVTCPDAAHHHPVPAPQPALLRPLRQRNRDRRRRRVSIAIDVDGYHLPRDRQPLGNGLQDAEVSL